MVTSSCAWSCVYKAIETTIAFTRRTQVCPCAICAITCARRLSWSVHSSGNRLRPWARSSLSRRLLCAARCPPLPRSLVWGEVKGEGGGGVANVDAVEHQGVKVDVEAKGGIRALNSGEDGSVSPEELGEQFLRGAVQQDFHTCANDREANDNVDLLAEAPRQVSLFDHSLDPLAEPRFPQVVAEETRADAEHTLGTRAAAKHAATRKAQYQSTSAKAQPKRSRR